MLVMFKKVLLVVFVLLAPLAYAGNASALSCALDESAPQENLGSREYVITAKYQGADVTEDSIYHADHVYEVQVTGLYKGDLGNSLKLKGNDWDGYSLQSGKEYLFLLSKDGYDSSTNTYTRQLCDYSDYYATDSQEYSSYIGLLGEPRSSVDKSGNESKSTRWLVLGGLAAVSLSATFAVYATHRRTRHRKK